MIPVRHAERHVLFEHIVWQWLAAMLAVLFLLLMARAVGGAELRPSPPRLVPPVERLWSQGADANRDGNWERAETLFEELATALSPAPAADTSTRSARASSRWPLVCMNPATRRGC